MLSETSAMQQYEPMINGFSLSVEIFPARFMGQSCSVRRIKNALYTVTVFEISFPQNSFKLTLSQQLFVFFCSAEYLLSTEGYRACNFCRQTPSSPSLQFLLLDLLKIKKTAKIVKQTRRGEKNLTCKVGSSPFHHRNVIGK